MKILLTGGGTMGSVSPLLALAEELNVKCQMAEVGSQMSNVKCQMSDVRCQMLWIGTKRGLERKVIEKYQIPFQSIFAGKLRRYFDWKNLIDPIFIFFGFIQSLFILLKFKPDIILAAGGFVSLPVIWAGWFLKIPSLIHQQDIKPSLTNKLCAPFASRITVTFEKSLKDFSKNKTVWTGNPVRKELGIMNHELGIMNHELGIMNHELGIKETRFMTNEGSATRSEAEGCFNLEENLPTILIIGGGTGALELNKIIIKTVPELTKFCQIIHLTGGKGTKLRKSYENTKVQNGRYYDYQFLTDQMKDAYAVADLVICRAGIGTLTELAALGKPAILIPLPDSHQEENARFFEENNAAIVVSQKKLDSKRLISLVKEILGNNEKLNELRKNIQKLNKPNATENIIREIFGILLR